MPIVGVVLVVFVVEDAELFVREDGLARSVKVAAIERQRKEAGGRVE